MHAHRIAAASLLLLLPLATTALADQKIKTKSNIKNDRVASSCGQGCADAGRQWAAENRITDAQACESPSPEFTAGCQAYLKAQQATPKASASG